MHIEKMQAKECKVMTGKPELITIVEKLRSALNRYDSIVCETRMKLQFIKAFPSTIDIDDKETNTESVTEEIISLLILLDKLNEKAECNLQHLGEII